MRRVDREIKTFDEIADVIKDGTTIQIAFIDNNEPYIVSMNFGYNINSEQIRFYFHSAKKGRKIDCIENNPKVCFTIAINGELTGGDKACDYGMNFRSVVGYGKIRIVEDLEEKKKGLNLIMKQYTGKDNWEYDTGIFDMTLVTCLEVTQITGKSKK